MRRRACPTACALGPAWLTLAAARHSTFWYPGEIIPGFPGEPSDTPEP